ncbi:hypothetical protein [Sphingomonas beigongshangi]|uniref:hypothetical protein n=1 Tax=Sphingomonas beigongshangi TaxID=2782540 RepID=UPI00193B07F3|nr:hypothetical protein [Sphingomonas beigongshangi]
MLALTIMIAGFLIGPAPAEVPPGKFQTWLSFKKQPLDFTSDGVTVHVEAVPCPAHPVGDSACRWDGYNNQANVTVEQAGMDSVTIKTDSQSAYARIAVARIRRGDRIPGIIIESQSGGSGGDMTLQLLVPIGNRYRLAQSLSPVDLHLQGQIADAPHDLSGDGNIDLKLEDAAFDSVFGCNACTPRPPKLLTVKDGQIIDESRDPGVGGIFAADMKRLEPLCLSHDRYRNGACAAYVADAARAGQFDAAWNAMLAHYERDGALWEPCDLPPSQWQGHQCPEGHRTRFRRFPDSLRAFLIRTGYLPDSTP